MGPLLITATRACFHPSRSVDLFTGSYTASYSQPRLVRGLPCVGHLSANQAPSRFNPGKTTLHCTGAVHQVAAGSDLIDVK
jgi:hypothetical protein